MLYFILLGLSASLCSGVPHVGGSRNFDQAPPPVKLAVDKSDITPQSTVPGAKRMRLLYGPYKLRAANDTAQVGNVPSMDKGGTAYANTVGNDFPKDITILEIATEVQTTKRAKALLSDGIYNHHSVLQQNFAQPIPHVLQCADKKPVPAETMSIIGGGATEAIKIGFWSTDPKILSGHYLPSGAQVTASMDVVNYNTAAQDVFYEVQVEYLAGKPANLLQTSQVRLEPGLCTSTSGYSIHPPSDKKQFSVQASNVVGKDGYLLRTRAHMHDGGVNIVLKLNGEVICDSKATYTKRNASSSDSTTFGTIESMSECIDPIAVHKGDVMSMVAHYDTALHTPRPMGGMGGKKLRKRDEEAEQMALMLTYFAESNS